MALIREMTSDDYNDAYELWSRTEGIALSDADSKRNIESYLNRNKGLSFIYEVDEKIVGTILCGHDGRRGYIYHVAVECEHRDKGIGRKLVESSLSELKSEGIVKCHIFVIEDNEIGNKFWYRTGWLKRDNILIYSKNTLQE